MKLIDQVKPEVLDALEKQVRPKYSASYRLIITTLSSHSDYRDLSIAEVDQLILFLPNEYHPNGRVDFYWGDYLLKKD
jgi:hypothetical protein